MTVSEMYRIAGDAYLNATPYSQDPIRWAADIARADGLLKQADEASVNVYGFVV